MLRFFCYFCLVAILLCGCTNTPEHNTFKEKYDAYADPQLNSEAFRTRAFPEHIFNYAWKLRQTDVPINKLEDFADALIRRMDAKTLPEYLKIQDEIDLLYFSLTDNLSAKRASEKYRTPSRHWHTFEVFTRDIVLWRFYIIRDEEGIQKMLTTLQYYKFLLSFDPDDALRIRREGMLKD